MGPRSALFVTLSGLLASGCAGSGQVERELSNLRQEMRALRAELAEESQARERLESRVTLLTADRRGPSGASSAAAAIGHHADRAAASETEPTLPELPVVKLPAEQRGHDGLGAVDDGGAPVMIRLGPGGGDERLPVDHAVLAKPDPVLGTSRVRESEASSPPSGKTMNEHYARALSKLRQENDPKGARRLLTDFIERYPKSDLGSNAAFWLGECSLVEKNYARAAQEFERLLTDHPQSAKIPDALLRLALSLKKLGKQREADEVARRLMNEHPDSEAAKQVPDQIGSLRG